MSKRVEEIKLYIMNNVVDDDLEKVLGLLNAIDEDLEFLDALQGAGVDNWEGYEMAQEAMGW